ncbi:hypothetical protein CDD83_9200 [Cordyceps sp. RAO-2017]|nr:hypothetical protein CDD83_9200 [Cordyceps sp. RAO-2017]
MHCTKLAGNETKMGGITYHLINLNQLPVGYAKAPLKTLRYLGKESKGYVLAGDIDIARGQRGKKSAVLDPFSV